MSRVGKKPIDIPKGVEVKIDGPALVVKGPKGSLSNRVSADIKLSQSDSKIVVSRSKDTKEVRALHGLFRSLISNMVLGVSAGFTRDLEIIGVGYKVIKQGKNIQLHVGYSKPVEVLPPEGIEFQIEGANKIKVLGIDKALVGQVAANIREVRPPEPYKGKGIRYFGEIVRKKAGKVAKVGAAAG
jgi:large subunit ribosomal protein L6